MEETWARRAYEVLVIRMWEVRKKGQKVTLEILAEAIMRVSQSLLSSGRQWRTSEELARLSYMISLILTITL